MSIFIIRNKETLEQWTAQSGKRSWNKPNHAKSAFANSGYSVKRDPLLKEYTKGLNKYESLKFNDQDIYEIVELYSTQEKRAAEIERIYFDIVKTLTMKGLTVNNWDSTEDPKWLDDIFKERNWFVES